MTKQRNYHRTAALLGAQTEARHLRTPREPIRVSWKAVVISVAVLALGLWVWLGDPWYLMLDDVRFHGVSTLDLKKEILIAADILGWHSFAIRPAKYQEKVLASCPELRDLQIDCRIFPASCDFHADERVPVLVWVSGVSSAWVDDEGAFFPVQNPRADLPVVRGPLPESGDSEAMQPILQGVTALVELGLPADDLVYSPQRGLIWTDDAGRRVAFGVGSEMQPRWEVYQRLSSHLDRRGISPRVIDVRFPDGVTYAMERVW
jgi:cell division septal protein FtsQ